MAAADSSLERLRAALDELATHDVAEVLAEARAEARARVRSILADALEESMLERVGTQSREEPQRTADPPTSGQQAATDNRTTFYVYGVLRREDADLADGLVGLGGSRVAALVEDELAAVVSEVPRRDFEESALRTHLADMAWVESVAREHQGVLDHLCSRTTVIPLRMCTVYHADNGVREMLSRETATLRDALDHLEGKREWGVQAFFSRSRAAQSTGVEADEPATGTAYLSQRREQRDLDERVDESVDEAVQEIHGLLAELAVDSTLNAPQRREASGHSGDMVLNGVYLVENENEEAFSERVRTLGSTHADRGLELGITGPWPPYNFLPGSIGATW